MLLLITVNVLDSCVIVCSNSFYMLYINGRLDDNYYWGFRHMKTKDRSRSFRVAATTLSVLEFQ